MRSPLLLLVVCGALVSCSNDQPTPRAVTPAPATSPPSTARPDIVLPPGELQELVPETADLPTGMVAILSGSGPRDASAVAAYSADPPKAKALLTVHGFRTAYVGQYADPATGRVLSVVVSRFATVEGAQADLSGDVSASSGEVVAASPVGDQSQVRRQPLPSSTPPGQLVTVRFRKAATTWLVAYGASPQADPQVALKVARILAARA